MTCVFGASDEGGPGEAVLAAAANSSRPVDLALASGRRPVDPLRVSARLRRRPRRLRRQPESGDVFEQPPTFLRRPTLDQPGVAASADRAVEKICHRRFKFLPLSLMLRQGLKASETECCFSAYR